jgi:16S rRNA (uracil1498-N3)-methyltransferase
LTTSRFYVSTQDLRAERLTLEGGDHHHASRVLRMRVGEGVILLDGRGLAGRGTIMGITPTHTTVAVDDRIMIEDESPRMHIFQALPGGTKMDIVVQLSVELGASSVKPFLSARASRPHGSLNGRMDRWRRIALETARIAGRPFLPRIDDVAVWEDALQLLKGFETSLFADEEGGAKTAEALGAKRPSDLALVIGPEGGFTSEERELLSGMGAKPVTLGYNVLRTETAGMVLLAAVRCHYGLL